MEDDFDDILGVAPKSEKSIVNDTLVELSALSEALVYRNNTGMAWQGKRIKRPVGTTVVVKPRMVILEEARPVKFGLEGSGDVMGAIAGVPVAVELKAATGRQRKAQELFQAAWERAGGLYVLARSAAEAVAAVKRNVTAHFTSKDA